MLKIKKLRETAKIPTIATAGSAGYDICADLPSPLEIAPGQTVSIPSGLAMQIPAGFGGFVFARSGLAVKKGIVPANCVGVIDSDYRGELIVALYNQSENSFIVNPGDRIAQLVLLAVHTPQIAVCTELDTTARGSGGFGSTGISG